jgi:cold shock CspA family protein
MATVEGAMKWTSSAKEFGFLTPDDGSREVFVRFASRTGSRCASVHRDEVSIQKEVILPVEQSDEGAAVYDLESRVEVRTRYQRGHWAPGYEIAQVVDSGYHVRRPGSLDEIPGIFVPTDVRPSRRRTIRSPGRSGTLSSATAQRSRRMTLDDGCPLCRPSAESLYRLCLLRTTHSESHIQGDPVPSRARLRPKERSWRPLNGIQLSVT